MDLHFNVYQVSLEQLGPDGPRQVYTALLILWALCFALAVRPSAKVYRRDTPDLNWWRIPLQILTAVLVPWLLFSVLADFDMFARQALIYPVVAVVLFLAGRIFTGIVADHGPDARAGKDFRFWVRILSEGETEHLFSNAIRSPWLVGTLAIALIVVVGGYVHFANLAYRLAHTPDVSVAASSGALFSGVSCIAFAVTSAISLSALNMQSVSFPVRYGVAANSLQVFLSATWAAIYPWFIFGVSDVQIQYGMGVAVIVAYVFLVFGPMLVWRSMFRQVRAVRLREFRRIVNRIEVAARPKPADLNEIDYQKFQKTSMRKAYNALCKTFRSIVAGSPFRAFMMIHINAIADGNQSKLPPEKEKWPLRIVLWRMLIRRRPRPLPDEHRDDVLCAHMKLAQPTLQRMKRSKAADAIVKRHQPAREKEDMDGYQRLVHAWIGETCDGVDQRYLDDGSRIFSALQIANPQLKKMVSQHRHGIEQTDYRYRLMYWSARLLSPMHDDKGETALKRIGYLLPLAHEVQADLDHLDKRWDSRSLVLSVGGTIATSLFSLMLAVGQGAAQATMDWLLPPLP